MSSIESFYPMLRPIPTIGKFTNPYNDNDALKNNRNLNLEDMIKEKYITLIPILSYKCLWQTPELAMQRIVYDNKLKQHMIKRQIKLVDSHDCQVKKIMDLAEKQLLFLKAIYTYFKKHEEHSKYIDQLKIDFDRYYNHYLHIRDYYVILPTLKCQYNKLLEADTQKNQCRFCFKWNNEIKRTKHGNQCKTCREAKSIIKVAHECPVCLEKIKINNYTKTRCGNNHIVCTSCYTKLQCYSSCCPLCRGIL